MVQSTMKTTDGGDEGVVTLQCSREETKEKETKNGRERASQPTNNLLHLPTITPASALLPWAYLLAYSLIPQWM